MLKWITPEVVRGPREHRAAGNGGEYLIKGPLQRAIPASRNVEEYFVVTRVSAPTGSGIASQRVGEAATLREAKALAGYHAQK
jgi:hypothetical protein